eukprot:CAMPEP_0197827056 /NCGR_PEP_ID=MMETSP1437-20131217/3929_1 /TAXON_ID=49252 ORGANISM="Eucampia antarctica, Strain CCMP1452" /NCGR_SAMPLE_ID=MMETSP1437 /ASSEMBLY_ACC=CAM_ASM_001096 /LENGTH=583 /DNA_ID=CAMNT_0043427771 /DNA_START=146 /DNA_END=1897 /DNA_ORIENTATION=+
MSLLPVTDGFVVSSTTSTISASSNFGLRMSATAGGNNNNNNDSMNKKSLVVISPPGGLGEVTAVDSAKCGNMVKWFVISSSESKRKKSSVTLSARVLQDIENAGGKIELAGSDVDALINADNNNNNDGDTNTAVRAVSQWCGSADALICTYDDGINSIPASLSEFGSKTEDLAMLQQTNMRNAIKVAAREASTNVNGVKLAVLPADVDNINADDEDNEDNGGILSSIFKRGNDIPATLSSAMATGSQKKVTTLRHGVLFGTPQSSPDASPFIGGPRIDPVLRDEHTMRSLRIDLSNSVSGKMMESGTKSNRLSVGEAAILMALKSVPISYDEMDVCLTSLRGIESLTKEEWDDEFKRIEETLSSTSSGQLFKASFGGVPSLERLTKWLATKWAPAVLRTYELAGIRVGARPVFVNSEGNTIEIVWQELVGMSSETVGRLIIEVKEDGITASRAAGDAASGFGTMSRKPLPGEDVLVRRLSDASSQAIEKGLANKPAVTKKPKKEAAPTRVVASTVAASGAVVPDTTEGGPKATLKTGPRAAGARRSSQRTRGKRKERVTPPPPAKEEDNPSSAAAAPDSDAFQ